VFRFCEDSVKVLWLRYLSPQPTDLSSMCVPVRKVSPKPQKYLQIPANSVIIRS